MAEQLESINAHIEALTLALVTMDSEDIPTMGQMLNHLADLLPGRSCTLPAARTRRAASRCLFGLAGGGVCPAITVTGDAVRSYRTISPLPASPMTGARSRRYLFCGTFPRIAPGRR